jgi:hypothetical protein
MVPSYGTWSSYYYWYGMELFANNAEIIFKKCTLISMYTERVTYTRWEVGGGLAGSGGFSGMISLGRMAKKGEITFSDCVIYTNGYLFRERYGQNNDFKKFLEVNFDNCVIYVETGFFMADSGSKDSKGQATYLNTKDVKDLKNYAKVNVTDCDFKKADFVRPPTLSGYRENGRAYMLGGASDPKKTGIGADIGTTGMPEPPLTEEKKI